MPVAGEPFTSIAVKADAIGTGDKLFHSRRFGVFALM
jgi:hypothetical protein